MREVAAEFERPALLFSGGKDSICLLRLAEKAFRPSDIPMPFLNIETGHEFPELIEFRDRRAKELGAKLIVRTVEDAIARGLAHPAPGEISRNKLQIPALLAAIEEFQFDCAIGGARRDEEKARAKERFFSFRDSFGQWDPKGQRPEIWNLYNPRVNPGENMRVFPLSNWTEMDVWEFIKREKLEVPAIYFSHTRKCVRRNNQWLPVTNLLPPKEKEHLLWQMRYDLLFQESSFEIEPVGLDMRSIRFTREIYYDGLTKNKLMEAVRENFKCELYVVWKFQEIFGEGPANRVSKPPEPMYG